MPFHPGINQTSKETAALTLGEQCGAHGDKDDEQRVCKHGAHLARPSPRSHPPRGESTPQSRRDREETWRDRPSRSTTTLTVPRLHFRFRVSDTELLCFAPAVWPPKSEESGNAQVSGDRRRAPGPVSRDLESQFRRRMAVWWRRRDLGSALAALRA